MKRKQARNQLHKPTCAYSTPLLAGVGASRSRPSNQTVEVTFEPALAASARGLSADPIRIPRASK
jgi:hypothetical protein